MFKIFVRAVDGSFEQIYFHFLSPPTTSAVRIGSSRTHNDRNTNTNTHIITNSTSASKLELSIGKPQLKSHDLHFDIKRAAKKNRKELFAIVKKVRLGYDT